MRSDFSKTVTVRSFAKINLGLYIGAARADGFHDLRTVYQTIALHDLIRVSVARGRGIEIVCTNNDARVPLNSSNTCYRAAERMMGELGASGRVRIEIEKRLPVQGGLGAASSNAVATMIALERALGLFRSGRQTAVPQGLKPSSLPDLNGTAEAVPFPKTLFAESRKVLPKKTRTLSGPARLRIAAEVGSDLPLFLVGGTVLGVGRGEEVYPLPDLPSFPMVIVIPEVGVSTPRAFADWDLLAEGEASLRLAGRTNASAPTRPRLTVSPSSDRLFLVGCGLSSWLTGFTDGGYPNTGASAKGGSRGGKLLSDLVRTGIENDFEKVVFPQYPELRDIKGALECAGAKYASLSGSGSTLFGLFASTAAANQAALRLRRQGLRAVATRTLTRSQYWKRVLD